LIDANGDGRDSAPQRFSIGKAHLFFRTHSKYPVRVSSWTVRNWVNLGILNQKTGQRVYLKATQIGGQVLTSMQDYEQFVKDLNGENLQGGGI